MGTGLIYAAIVAAWAAYLVPLWLRRHDEEAESRSVDRFGAAMRALAGSTEAAAGSSPAAEATAPSATSASAGSESSAEPSAGSSPEASASTGAEAGRSGASTGAGSSEPIVEQPYAGKPRPLSPATRRRRTLVGLLAVASGCAVFGAVGLVPWWAFGLVGLVLIGFLTLSTRAGRAERARFGRTRGFSPITAATRVAGQVSPASSAGSSGVESVELVTADASAATEIAEVVEVVAVLPDDFAAPPADPDAWDPVDVPLPTYVTKAKAEPPVRPRIEPDLGEVLLDESEREPTGIRDELYDRELYGDFGEPRAVND